jgi:hypothetical protein
MMTDIYVLNKFVHVIGPGVLCNDNVRVLAVDPMWTRTLPPNTWTLTRPEFAVEALKETIRKFNTLESLLLFDLDTLPNGRSKPIDEVFHELACWFGHITWCTKMNNDGHIKLPQVWEIGHLATGLPITSSTIKLEIDFWKADNGMGEVEGIDLEGRKVLKDRKILSDRQTLIIV